MITPTEAQIKAALDALNNWSQCVFTDLARSAEEKDAIADKEREFALHIPTIRALLTASVKPGWKIVPIEPTSVMEGKGSHYIDGHSFEARCEMANIIYKAMLSAAPQPDEVK